MKEKISIYRSGREPYPKEETVIFNAQRQEAQCALIARVRKWKILLNFYFYKKINE